MRTNPHIAALMLGQRLSKILVRQSLVADMQTLPAATKPDKMLSSLTMWRQ